MPHEPQEGRHGHRQHRHPDRQPHRRPRAPRHHHGTAVANFRLGVTPRVRQGDTWTDGETSFFRINCWRQLAENVTETLSK
ncbi:MAG TPA: single-stranded DNA-binding protein, partial [Actinomycetes bacterium]|nr:single-stranded DNA-binding protein [Actinomycetes bacterium]